MQKFIRYILLFDGILPINLSFLLSQICFNEEMLEDFTLRETKLHRTAKLRANHDGNEGAESLPFLDGWHSLRLLQIRFKVRRFNFGQNSGDPRPWNTLVSLADCVSVNQEFAYFMIHRRVVRIEMSRAFVACLIFPSLHLWVVREMVEQILRVFVSCQKWHIIFMPRSLGIYLFSC